MALLHLRLCFSLLVALASTTAFILPSPHLSSRLHQESPSLQTAIVEKSTEEWQSILSQDEFYVLREKGTEAPNSSVLNELDPSKDKGVLTCAGCKEPLFSPETKFDSGTGWPSFTAPISSSSVAYNVDFDLILPRTECVCASCGGHLGHVFDDGPQPTGLRYCLNGVSMQYTPTDENDSATIIQQQQPETDAAQLPLASILPNVALNLGVAALFIASWLRHEHRPDAGPIGLLLENFPLPIAAFYIYSSIKSVLKAKR